MSEWVRIGGMGNGVCVDVQAFWDIAIFVVVEARGQVFLIGWLPMVVRIGGLWREFI